MRGFNQTRSRIQEQFFLASTLFPTSPAYNIPGFIRIEGALDLKRLEEAWQKVFSSIDLFSEGFYQKNVLAPQEPLQAPWIVETCTEEEAAKRAMTEVNKPFELGNPPLVRCILYRINSELHALLIIQHHIVTDLFSKQLLVHTLSRAYENDSYTPEFLSYQSFAEAEKAYETAPEGERAKAFWKEKIASNADVLHLPSQLWNPRPFSGTGHRINWKATSKQADRLKELAVIGKAPFLMLLSAYAGLLSRLSGQHRFYIGVPLTNRYSFDDKPLFGPCVNILPILVETEPEITLSALYEKIRRQMLENHRNQGLPFVEIANMYDGPRDPLRPRFLQAGFTNEPPMTLDLTGLKCSPIPLAKDGAQMDLFFTWWEDETGWAGYWEYNDASFCENDVNLWQEGYSRILDASLSDALQDHTIKLGDIRLIDQTRESFLAGADRSVKYPLEGGMASILRKAYIHHTAETALVFRGNQENYADFSKKVARCAARIHTIAGSKGRILVLHERNPEMLYALHGIVHSGNTYVPLGIDWPQARIDDIIEDITPALVLTQESFKDRFVNAKCPVLQTSDLVSEGNAEFPDVSISPEDSMYILYTSGTTGRPKGAELPHGGIANRLLWMQDEYKLVPKDRCLLKTPYTFDVSGWELFWPFMVGSTLVISEEGQHKDPRELLRLMVAEGVRIVHFVPSMLSHFLDQDGLEAAAALKDVVCSGEALTTELVSRFFNRFPAARLHNLYGPTEASIDVSYWACSKADIERGTVPIGWPIANTQIWILDDRGNPCPPLVRGEIFLGGIGLAKGYWNRPELTAERFVPNPFGPGKLYKTGDWGRYGLDGAVEYLERRDDQVKIRGVRIELSEIEAHLRGIPTVENGVVKKAKTHLGADCLIAYYVSRNGKDIPTEEITAELRKKLPETVIPETFLRLDAFPKSENGKIDRKDLPNIVPQNTSIAQSVQFEGPEAAVAKIWMKLLGGTFGERTNFFDAGGNSLLLLSLRTELERCFNAKVSLMDLFTHATIPAMAHLFSAARESDGAADTEKIEERSARRRENLAKMSNIYRKKPH